MLAPRETLGAAGGAAARDPSPASTSPPRTSRTSPTPMSIATAVHTTNASVRHGDGARRVEVRSRPMCFLYLLARHGRASHKAHFRAGKTALDAEHLRVANGGMP
jgi:hypothetical protein